MDISSGLNLTEWVDIYKKIIGWELKLDESGTEMDEILSMQKTEANAEFSKFVTKNYETWIQDKDGAAPVMSHNLLRSKVFSQLDSEASNFVLLLDNLRYDQWKVIEPIISELFRIEKEDYFYSILPTATQYSRNAIFAGMLPSDIQKAFGEKWLNDNQSGGKNMNEEFFLGEQIKRSIRKEFKWSYTKITNVQNAKNLDSQIVNMTQNDFNVIVYNFIDMLSHARTEMEVLKELAGDEKAYRSLTRSWFLNSPLWTALQRLADRNVKLFITTDHGTIRVKSPSKVVGDRETTTNLRYKVGRNLQYNKKDVLEIRDPLKVGLPKPNVSSSFIFATEDKFFLYPNNYNHFNRYYRDTFQHGGISLEEVICPIVTLNPR